MSPTLGQMLNQIKNTAGPVWDCGVLGLSADEKTGGLQIVLEAERVLQKAHLDAAAAEIKQAYGVENTAFSVKYKLRSLDAAAAEHLRQQFILLHPSAAPCLREAQLEGEAHRLIVRVAQPWQAQRITDLIRDLEKEAAEAVGMPVAVSVELPEGIDAAKSYEEKRREDLERLQNEFRQQQSAAAQSIQKPQPAAEKPKSFIRKKDPNAVQFKPKESDEVIYGRASAREFTKLEDITVDSGKVTVQGEIFMKEARKLNGKGKTVLSFEFSDGTGSIHASKVMPDDEAKELDGKLKNGMYVIVQGTVMYNQYDKDINLSPTAIIKGEKKKRKDTAEEKRVELHLHTTMSSMDGLCDVGKAAKLASSFGHRAMAVTDHGVAQAFPDAMKAASGIKKSGKEMKILYGVEAYCVNDIRKKGVVKGYSTDALDSEIIVFDLETTGLSPVNCQIIEIAAVKVRGGEAVERYHTYVKPDEPIPAKITELTGIHDGMVADARKIDEVLPEFFDFCGDRPMCAHNADFDISFLTAAANKLGIPREFCSIDTVELSRALMPQLNKHKLNVVADALGFTFTHHRASDDADVLAKIFLELLQMLKQRTGCEKINQINDAVEALQTGGTLGKGARTYHLLILVKNREGLIALYKLISEAHLKYYHRRPIIPMSRLAANREHLILGSACEAGELFGAVAAGKPWKELMQIAEFYDFLEIQPIGNNRFMIAKELAKDEEQLRDFNRTIVKLGDALNKPVCATGDVHFLEPEDSIYREILMTGMGFEDASNQAPLYYKTTDEMLEEFAYLGAKKAKEVVVTNTNMIADMCEDIQPVLDGTYPPSIENSAKDIEDMARSKVKELYEYEGELPQIVSDRLEAELVPIIKHGFDVMYIIAQKLVAKSMAAGYLVGSRGSVGSSFVAYLTGITEVNGLQPHYRCPECRYSIFNEDFNYQTGIDLPDRECPKCGTKMVKDGFNIPFATFLGFNADKAPDIDLNFSGEYQAQAHKETVALFGKDNVFKAGTIGTIKDKTAYGYVKKYLEEKGKIVGNAEVNRLTAGCTGIKRTTGQHPGGLIVVPQGRSIYEFTPVQHPADDPDSDIITTHFDFHSIHDNLLKLDELGHDVPTLIRHLWDISGINPQNVPLDDPDTMRLFTDISPLGIETDDILGQPGTAAIPEFGTKFVRGMLMDTQPTTFDGLVRISGLSHGTDVWLNNAADYIKQGKATLKDVICVRDDITTHLIEMGMAPKQSFTISEAVRKGKGLKPEWEEEMRAHNLPDWYIESCNKIQYMFPRAHAAAYTMMSYRIAWFKVHQPLAFYCTYFSSKLDAFDAATTAKGDGEIVRKYRELKAMPKRTAVEEDHMTVLEVCHEFCKRGFQFAPLDIYRSDIKKFRIEGNTLIPPFCALPGLGEAAAQSIVEERKNGPFMSMEDMILRCDRVSRSIGEALAAAGALGDIPLSNQLNLFDDLM